MQNFLDMRTIIFVSGITSLILFACMLYIRRKQRTYEGFICWIFAALVNSTGLFLLSLRDILPDFLTIIAGNTFIIFSVVLISAGLSRFAGVRPYSKFYSLLMLLFVALYSYFTYFRPVFIYRSFVFYSFQALLCIVIVIIVHRDLPRVLHKKSYVLYWFLILSLAWPFFLIFSHFFEAQMEADLIMAGLSHQITFLGSIAAYIVLVIALIVLTAQRVEEEMIEAKKEIKTIAGFIPICASCKKIRDDKGSWNQMEAYLSQHADLQFSHGLCPECMKKMYPEEAV